MTQKKEPELTLEEAEEIIAEGLEPMQAVGVILEARTKLANALMSTTDLMLAAAKGPLHDEDGEPMSLNEENIRKATAKLLRKTMLDTMIALESLGARKGTFEDAQVKLLDALAVKA
jgi:hypothetical protein